MTPFERLYAVATGPGDVCAKAREIIGTDQLALALCKFAFEGTTLSVSPADAAEALDAPKSTIAARIDRIGLKTSAIGQNGTNR
jgi:hypothetical protein